MFESFANVWTPVTQAKHLTANVPLGVMLAGERVVFFRKADGTATALIDRCPHRGVQLSLGKRTADGCLECPFHAWTFNSDGHATYVPLNPDAKRERLFATPLPTREIGGLLWVYTAAGTTAPSEPIVPDGLTMKASRTFIEVEWKAHWTRAMENMLDNPHVPYVHAKTIGRFVRPYLHRDTTMEVDWEETEYGGRVLSRIAGVRDMATLDFFKPNIMVLNIPIPGKVFRMHALCVPVTDRTVRMIVIGARTFATLPLLNPFFNLSNKRIVKEDQAIVESSDPIEVPPPAHELSVRTDKATLQFRKYYYETLKPSTTPPRQQPTLATEAA
jgi:nitrite reductase/ring-hydroxylating ferredoxin subunit